MRPLLCRPTDELAGCVFLPRFRDKVVAHKNGTLTGDFLMAFGHPRGMDGRFFAHFGLTKETAAAAIEAAPDDASVAAWFLAQPGVTAETIATWNALAPNIGREGFPGHREFQIMLKRGFRNNPPPVPLGSVFEAIDYDEGFANPSGS